MDKEIKGYKDDSNEEKNTETNEKGDIEKWQKNVTARLATNQAVKAVPARKIRRACRRK